MTKKIVPSREAYQIEQCFDCPNLNMAMNEYDFDRCKLTQEVVLCKSSIPDWFCPLEDAKDDT